MIKLKKNKWVLRANYDDTEQIQNIAMSLGCSVTLATLIFNRGYTDAESASAFLNMSQEILHDPFLLNEMDIAVDRILDAVSKKEKITIYGDFDADGVTSVGILYLYLKSLDANVDYYIPSRQKEGYGVSCEAVEKLHKRGTKLMITVDTGVTAIEETKFANELGMDIVVTDHHECTDILPNAIAVINPKRKDTNYPFPSLAGVGVVFKLLCALETVYSNTDIISAMKKITYSYADLTAIGTIADVMPVVDENRIIISLGLALAEKTDKVGLRALIDVCRNGEGKQNKYKKNKKLVSGFVSYSLAPKINAAGRIGSANTALELFLSNDEKKVNKLALELCDINKERQHEENRIADLAFEIIEKNDYTGKSILVLDNDSWHHGIIGIVSSRVTEKCGLPSILISFEGNEDPNSPEAIGKGSGRSLGGFNLVKALKECDDLLEKAGGHELAAGLTIKRKNLDEFKKRIDKIARTCFDGKEPEQILELDCELDASDLTLELANEITCLEPYGTSNNVPTFVTRNMQIADITPTGMNRHLKFTLYKDKRQFTAMLFSTSPQEFPFSIGDEIDIAYNLEINEYNGVSSLQFNLKDVKMSQRFLELEAINEQIYQSVKLGECTLGADYIIPTRDDFAVVYQYLQGSARLGKSKYRISKLLMDLSNSRSNIDLNYVKLKTIIKVFRELNIITIEETDDYSFSFKFSYVKNKTNLEKSNILKKLKQTYNKK